MSVSVVFLSVTDCEGDDNYPTTSESIQDLKDEEERISELLRLVQVYRENSSMRYQRLQELIASLEAKRNMMMSSSTRSHLQRDIHSFPLRKRSFDQSSPSFLTSNSDRISQLEGPHGTGRFKTDEGRETSSLSENPSNLAGVLGLAPLGMDRSQLFQHRTETSASSMPYPPSFSATQGGGDNRDRLLLGQLLADQHPRSSLMPENSTEHDHGSSTLQLTAQALSGHRRELHQPNSITTARSTLLPYSHHQSDSESSSSPIKNH